MPQVLVTVNPERRNVLISMRIETLLLTCSSLEAVREADPEVMIESNKTLTPNS